MKILIITQSVDQNDTALGFFIGWIKKMAEHAESIEIICLREGAHVLPANVTVHSLGGEKSPKKNRFAIARLFLRYIFSLRSSYDIVFVHMNQEYILLGGIFWKLFGKKIFFWRNHPRGDWRTRIAIALSDKVFYTAEQSFTAQYKGKAQRMPAGIDTDRFYPEDETVHRKNSILVFGRIAPIKHIDLAIRGCAKMMEKNVEAQLTIVGDALPRDSGYMQELQALTQSFEPHIRDRIHFSPAIPFEQAPQLYHSHGILLNCTESGSFDKTILEALACGMKVVTTNESMKDILPEGSYTERNLDSIAFALEHITAMDARGEYMYKTAAAETVTRQSLDSLMKELFSVIHKVSGIEAL